MKGWMSGLVAVTAMAWVAPATATTVTVTPKIWDFIQHGFQGAFVPNTVYAGQHIAVVGWDTEDPGTSLYGAYAATMDFALPSLPDGATDISATLTIVPDIYQQLGDTELRTYLAPTTMDDPSRLFGGSYLTTFQAQTHSTSFDVTSVITSDLSLAPAGYVAGFSFRQLAQNCPAALKYGLDEQCFTIMGSEDGGSGPPYAFSPPRLAISYDLPPPPPPPSPVPEPASWTTLAGGLLLAGGALRWCRVGRAGGARGPAA